MGTQQERSQLPPPQPSPLLLSPWQPNRLPCRVSAHPGPEAAVKRRAETTPTDRNLESQDRDEQCLCPSPSPLPPHPRHRKTQSWSGMHLVNCTGVSALRAACCLYLGEATDSVTVKGRHEKYRKGEAWLSRLWEAEAMKYLSLGKKFTHMSTHTCTHRLPGSGSFGGCSY